MSICFEGIAYHAGKVWCLETQAVCYIVSSIRRQRHLCQTLNSFAFSSHGMVLPTSRVSIPRAVNLCWKYLHSHPESCASIVILNTVSLTVKILITPSQLEAVFYNIDHMCKPNTLRICQSCLFCHTFDVYDYHYLYHDDIYHHESYERAKTITIEN